MHVSSLLLTPILIVLWICLILITKYGVVTNPDGIHLKTGNNKSSSHVKNKSTDYKVNTIQSKMNNKIKYHVPKFMLELYEKSKIGVLNSSSPDVVRSVIPKQAGSLRNNNLLKDLSDNHLLIFDLPAANKDEIFVSAELKLYTLVEKSSKSFFGVERKLKLWIYDDFENRLVHWEEIHICHSNNTWMSFNLTKPVIEMLSHHCRNLKIIITVSSLLPIASVKHVDGLKLSLMPSSVNLDHNYPILLLSYSSNASSNQEGKNKEHEDQLPRRKRNIEEDYEEETNNIWDEQISKKIYYNKKLKRLKNTCKRKPLYIDFSEISYDDWIVQPAGYEAFQCQGRCFYPVADHLNPTKHAIVQTLLHSVAPSRAVRTCCVPTTLDSISILYIDSNGVLTYRYAYKEMVVIECGCR